MNVPAGGGAPARRRPRRDEVRARILDAAEQEFLLRGYARAKLSDIADRAGYTKGALYSNFESKAELFLSLMRERFDRVVSDQMADIASRRDQEPSPGDSVAGLATRLSALTLQDEAWHVLVVELALLATRDEASAALYRRSREIVQQRVETVVEALLGPILPADAADRTALLSSIMILLVNIVALDGAIDRERFTAQFRAQMFEAALRGAVVPPPG